MARITAWIMALLIFGLAGPRGLAAGEHDPGSVTAAEAWRMLREGNERFARNMSLRPHSDLERRIELSKSQHPFAIVLSCSDSRLPPELIFDAGLGDLFAIRVAGNAASGDMVLGSIEYAVEHLGAKLILVLGHQKCGAVTAAVAGMKPDDKSSVDDLLKHLRAPVREAKDKVGDLKKNEVLDEAIEKNTIYQIKELLQHSPAVKERVETGEVLVVGGVYSLDNGKVQWIGEHPSKKEVLENKKP